MLEFQVLGRQLPLLPTAAEEKASASAAKAPATTSPLAPNPSAIAAAGVSPVAHGAATSATAAGLATGVVGEGGSSGGGGGVHQNRRSSRAAAVAATVAAVASAKAATDDAVASVSSSGRHRSIGTSISDTLVITAHPGSGEAAAVANRPNDGGDRSGTRHIPAAAAWPEPAPGKDDGSRGGNHGRGVAAALGVVTASAPTAGHYDSEHKWHKHATGPVASVGDSAMNDDKARDRRDNGSAGAVGSGNRIQDAADAKGAEMTTRSRATPAFVTNPWSQDLRGGGGILGAGEGGKGGGGGDSPPLLGSPEPAPAVAAAAATAAVASPPPRENNTSNNSNNLPFFPSSSRRSPDAARQREPINEAVGRSSNVGVPTTADAEANRGAGVDAGSSPPGGLRRGKESPVDASKALNAADIFSEANGGGGDGGEDGGGGGVELGMTRPRTATRRWDRPGPPGDDEVIGKTLLSRASVTSTLSAR